jgi:hypothetical protein
VQKDNSTGRQKALLRQNLLREFAEPVVMETHAGNGHLYMKCYGQILHGVAFEVNPDKTAILARQRPTWAIYECDCIPALRAGVGSHLAVNFFDLDPYGDPWPVLDALFGSERPWPGRIGIAVNDGLRQKLQATGGWDVNSMAEMVVEHGNGLYRVYLDVCRELLCKKAAQRGYRLVRWAGYYCGYHGQIAHYAAVLEK